MLRGDFMSIKQIAGNLLGNASKYSEHGGIALRFTRKTCKEKNRITLCISVADTGVGILREDMDKIFAAFTRANTKNARYIQGVGLSLAIARESALMMGGWRADPLSGSKPKPAGAACSFIAPGGRVLAVDDDCENLLLIRHLLGKTRIYVDTAENGEACLEAVRRNRYHAILMDCMMPSTQLYCFSYKPL
jgi:signal transduction histidine kinase